MKSPNKLECDRQKADYSAEGQREERRLIRERERETHFQPSRGAHAAGHPRRTQGSLHTRARLSWGGNGGIGNA